MLNGAYNRESLGLAYPVLTVWGWGFRLQGAFSIGLVEVSGIDTRCNAGSLHPCMDTID